MIFASREWFAALVAALNRQSDLAKLLEGLGADAAVVVERDGGLPRDTAAYGRNEQGKVVARILDDADEVLELEPAYVFRAPYTLWKQLLRGEVDPLKAALSGRLKVKGDLQALVRRAGFRYVTDAALGAVATEFPDEEE